jgi:PAS domain S-box-containing protein
MGVHPASEAVPGTQPRPAQEVAGLVQYAIDQVVRNEPGFGGLASVLGRFATAWDAQAALALVVGAGGAPAILAGYPAAAAGQARLAASIAAQLAAHPGAGLAGSGGCFGVPLAGGDWPVPASALIAWAAGADGEPRCVLGLVGDPAGWDAQTRSTARMLATVVAARVRQAGEVTPGPAAGMPPPADGRFRLLSQRAPVGIAETGPDGRCTFVNERWCLLNGGAAADYDGRDWLSVVHPEDLGRVREQWSQAAAAGRELDTDCRLAADGGERWAHATVAALPAGPGGASGFAIALTDETARKAAEQAHDLELDAERQARRQLSDQADRAAGLIAMAIPAIVVADQAGRVSQVNESFRGMFGIAEPPAVLIGRPGAGLARRIAPLFADPAGFLATMERLAAARQPVSGLDLTCADGRLLGCDYWPMFVGGAYRGDIWLFWDGTRRKRDGERQQRELTAARQAREAAEAERRRLAEENAGLREVADLKSEFLATVSRELRGPLTSIVSYTELISEEKDRLSTEAAAFLGVVERSADQLTRLVDDLLLLSQIESGIAPLELAPVSVREVVAEAVRSAAPAAERNGVDLEGYAEDGPLIDADRVRLRQVIENLLVNAVKFAAAGGTVRVTASCASDRWRIEVTDSGMGIPAGELDRVFERFYRATNGRRAGRPGSGLGLAVVKALIALHGGRVDVVSTVGRGSTFSVILPLPPAPAGTSPPGLADPAGQPGPMGSAGNGRAGPGREYPPAEVT